MISGFLLEVIRKLRRVRTAIGQELRARYSVPEKLPDALSTLVNQLDDQQKQECSALLVCRPCRAAATPIYLKTKR